MKYYQGILNQCNLPYGALWCYEGVYPIAKEMQLLRPDTFRNIFLRMVDFPTEKIVLACLVTVNIWKKVASKKLLVESV